DYANSSANPASNTFKNNLLQLDSATYQSIAFASGSNNNIFNRYAIFVDTAHINGVDNILGTTDDGLRLSICSPGIDAGINYILSTNDTVDLQGANRIQSDSVDIGAYEG